MEKETFTQSNRRRRPLAFLPIVFLVLFAYVFWQAYLVNFNGVHTVKATQGYINDSLVSQGIICRDEYVLTRSSDGSVDYLLKDGERVSRGALLANAYASESDVEKLAYLRNRQALLADINSSIDYLYGSAMDVSVARKQLANQLSDLAYINSSGSYSQLYDNLNGITFSLNKIAVATGRATDFSGAQSQIEAEVDSIKSSISPAAEALYAPRTGYFITKVDGYENLATVDRFANISYEEGMDIISSSGESTGINQYGKIITDYKWNLCTYVNTSDCEDLYEGKNVNISISVKDNTFNKAVIKKMVELGDKTLIVTQCSIMDSESATTRLCDCEILFKQYRGIKIPKTAIHFVDGEMGVYVNYSNVVQFKKINPVFEDDNYVIVPSTTSADNQVKLYDSIIVKGRNLYDGKYL